MEEPVTADGEKKAPNGESTGSEPVLIHMPVDVRSLSLSILAVLAVVITLQYAQSVLIPIVLGILLSYSLTPIVSSLARLHVPRAIGAAVSVVLLVGAIGVGVYTLSDEAASIVAKIPDAAQRIRERVTAHNRQNDVTLIKQVQQAAKEIEKTADFATTPADDPRPARVGRDPVQRVQMVEPAFRASDYIWIGGVGLFGFLGQFAVILFLVYFLLVTGGLALVAFMQFDNVAKTLYVSGAAFAITSLEGFLLTPMMMGRAAQMNPVAIFIGLLFWSWVWGVWGTVLAVPMLMMLKSICDHVEDLQPIGELLGE